MPRKWVPGDANYGEYQTILFDNDAEALMAVQITLNGVPLTLNGVPITLTPGELAPPE